MNPTTNDKLAALRAKMQKHGLNAYVIPSADPHQSEYVAERFQARAYFSGFQGSAGTLVVTMDKSALWTDGRYVIVAEQNLRGTEIALMHDGMDGVPTPFEWLSRELRSGQTVGLDGRLFSFDRMDAERKLLESHAIVMNDDIDLVDETWPDRPGFPRQKIFLLSKKSTGLSCAEKLVAIRAKLEAKGCDAYFICALDSVAWLTNLRGNDVAYTPVFYAYALVEKSSATLFVDRSVLDAESALYLQENGVSVRDYDDAMRAVGEKRRCVYVDGRSMGASMMRALQESGSIVMGDDIIDAMKARKNPAEIEAMTRAGVLDGAAMTRFWSRVSRGEYRDATEWDLSLALSEERKKSPYFVDLSFPAIVATGANGAMMHYGPSAEKSDKIVTNGLTVVDSGAQFMGGTTDITRMGVHGKLTDEERTDYTLTLKSHIALAGLTFLKGATGAQLDGVARQVMWNARLDYKCGTGHGVGAMLSVHEGPFRINSANTVPFDVGMIVSVEPGVYKRDKHGVRIENLYLCQEKYKSGDDLFLAFTPITFCPINKDGIDKTMLNDEERSWLNAYHAVTREKLTPLLTGDDLAFLNEATSPL